MGIFRVFGGKGRGLSLQLRLAGGESGIRTHVTLSSKHAFQACAFSHSAISPRKTWKDDNFWKAIAPRRFAFRTDRALFILWSAARERKSKPAQIDFATKNASEECQRKNYKKERREERYESFGGGIVFEPSELEAALDGFEAAPDEALAAADFAASPFCGSASGTGGGFTPSTT